jgi:hypothetical protein
MLRRPEIIPVSLNGDLRRGGWIMTARVDGDTDAVTTGRYLQYRGRSLAGWVDPAHRLAFDGYVMGLPNFSFDRYSSQATFQFGTVDNLLTGGSLQDVSFAVVASPSNSHEATSWRFSTMIQHILKSHTNFVYDADGSAGDGSPEGVLTVLDFDASSTLFDTAGDYFIVNSTTNLWATLQQIGGGEEGGGEFYRIYCKRDGSLVYTPAPAFISPAPTAKGTLDTSLIRGAVGVQYINNQPGQQIGQVQIVAGIRPANIYNAQYPASPASGKIFEKKSGIWAQSQARADTLAERLYKWLTRPYTLTVNVDAGLALFGDDGAGLDLGDRLLVTYDGAAADADTGGGVHLSLSAQAFFVYGININLEPERRRATATLTLEYANV